MRQTKKLCAAIMTILCVTYSHAQILHFTNDEMQAYAENYDAIAFRCTISGSDALAELKMNYSVPNVHQSYLLKLFVERDVRKATYDYTCHDPRERVLNKHRIDSLYMDSVNIRLIPYNDKVAGPIISTAARLSNALDLTSQQNDMIIATGLKIARQLQKNPYYQYDVEVMDSLRSILSNDLIVRIAKSKNYNSAYKRTQNVLDVVKKQGLFKEVKDEDGEINNAMEYYLQELVLRDIYVGHENVLRNNLQELWNSQPQIVRMYESIKTKEKLQKEKNSKKSTHLSW